MIGEDQSQPVKLLTIGGSDSGGAAGIQADLKTWTALRAYGMSVITAVTAQNSVEVSVVQYLSPDHVIAQIDAVMLDYGAQAVKTGFIGRADLVQAVADGLGKHQPAYIIVDPVLVNHQNSRMFPPVVTEAYYNHLLPLADLITPNWAEALLLCNIPADTKPNTDNISEVMRQLHTLGARQVLITGTVLDGILFDTFSDGLQQQKLVTPWIETENSHGSGDTLSAAICTYLARGYIVFDAIIEAQEFTSAALQAARLWHLGKGHGPLSHFT